MTVNEAKLTKLRTVITESLRIQRGEPVVPYIDPGNVLTDVSAKQNHVIFARRGCGKSLLLHDSARALPPETKAVYLNCEDFKRHSFPNVLIEIIDGVFSELAVKRFAWFGRRKRAKILIDAIRAQLSTLREEKDEQEVKVKQTSSSVIKDSTKVEGSVAPVRGFKLGASKAESAETKAAIERQFEERDTKVDKLNKTLPEIKSKLREFFECSTGATFVFVQLDDFYHLRRADQPYVMDYVHRLCKDVPLFFKVATLRHASTLYADRDGQPTGAQERHDYQPINIDFSFENFSRTEDQIRRILREFGSQASISPKDVDGLFKGEGFARLVLAGGGVPRDCLSLFLDVLGTARTLGDGRIGKDDVRQLSRATFERRIEELKQDSAPEEQDGLLRGIHAIREFCISNKSNIFVVSEQELRAHPDVNALLFRLLDYRIIHSLGAAFTHKTHEGAFRGFAIDVGCYAYLRKLHGKMFEVDVSSNDIKENVRSAKVLSAAQLNALFASAPATPEAALLAAEDESD
jgi:hypothetical protein